ncbi:hypothetical protein AB6G16_09030 [Proteus mirabilis]|uniref:hypothetical protein n=1 Tax=Proteus mirabilis TaxID=584 RepID=UPI0034DDDE3E
MTDELGKTRDSFIVKAWNLVISFIVGLSAFFILRLIILITLNLIATSNNVATIQTIGGIMVVLSIGIAAIYTKILNSSGTLESRKRKKNHYGYCRGSFLVHFYCTSAYSCFLV